MRHLVGPRTFLAVALLVALGLGLGLGLSGGHAAEAVSDKRPPNPLTKKVIACERSGKVICDPVAYQRDRAHEMFALSKPDPTGARVRTLQEVLPSAWRHMDYAAELMTYGQAQKLAPGLAAGSSAVVDPSRKFWVLTLYHSPPIKAPNITTGPPAARVPSKITVRVESQTVDAVTGQAVDSCINCAAIRELRYPPEGVTLMTPFPGYHSPVSRARVLELYHRWPAGPHLTGRRTVRLWTVRDALLPRGGYPAWVITFPHTRPISYGPESTPQKAICAWVAIYNLEARVWTWNFQNCPETTVNYPEGHKKIAVVPSCDSGCTPANQDALDGAADDARRVAGAAHVYTGASIDDTANQVVLYLAHAPQDVIDRLNAAHPGTYVIHNDAPRTAHELAVLQNALDFNVLEPEGIRIVSVGPSVDGYLEVGVTSKVAEAQARLDAKYGPNVVRVFLGEASMPASLTLRAVTAVRSTQAREADAAEVRLWRKEPRAFMVAGHPTVIRFVLPGGGCKPKGVSARVAAETLTLALRPAGTICTTATRLYEVTVTFATPILNPTQIHTVIVPSGQIRRRMRLVTIHRG